MPNVPVKQRNSLQESGLCTDKEVDALIIYISQAILCILR